MDARDVRGDNAHFRPNSSHHGGVLHGKGGIRPATPRNQHGGVTGINIPSKPDVAPPKLPPKITANPVRPPTMIRRGGGAVAGHVSYESGSALSRFSVSGEAKHAQDRAVPLSMLAAKRTTVRPGRWIVHVVPDRCSPLRIVLTRTGCTGKVTKMNPPPLAHVETGDEKQ